MEKLDEGKIKKLVDKNLIGYIEITYIDDNDKIKTFYLPGILVESLIVIVPYIDILDEIMENSSIVIRFYLYFTEYKKQLFIDTVDKETFKSSELYADMKFSDDRKWSLFVLSNNVGDFLQLGDITYYSGDILNENKLHANLVFTKILTNMENKKVDISYSLVNEYFVTTNKIYINLDEMNSCNGIVISEKKKIVGFVLENESRIITVRELENIITESKDNRLIQHFNKNFKHRLNPELKLIEVNPFETFDLNIFQICVLNGKKDFFMYGANNTLTSYNNYFKNHFSIWERSKALIAAGPELIKKLCRQYKIISSSLNIYLIIHVIILESKTQFNIEHEVRKNLSFANLKLEAKHFTAVIYAYFFDNLEYIDLTNVRINDDIIKTLSNFMYRNSSMQSLILKETGINYNQLFIILTSIRQGPNRKFSLLNISKNKFREKDSELQEDFTLENPGIFKFCIEICKIPSLTSLIISNVQPQEDVLCMFSIMDEFYTNSNRILNLDLENYKNQFNKINLSNVEFSKNSSKFFPYDYFSPISDFISLSNTMQEIYFPYCGLTDEEIILLCRGLSQGKNTISNMKNLDLSGNIITTKGAEYIKNFLSKLISEYLTFNELKSKYSKKNFSDMGLKNIKSKYKFLKGKLSQQDLSSFTLCLNNIPSLEPGGVSIICEGISEKSVPLNLHLDGIKIKNEGLYSLYNSLKSGHPIIHLSLANNHLVDLHIHSIFFRIFSEIDNECYLNCLNLNSNKFTSDSLFNLSDQMNFYSEHHKINPCKLICDPIDFKYLKQFIKNKDINNDLFKYSDIEYQNNDVIYRLLKNVQFYYK